MNDATVLPTTHSHTFANFGNTRSNTVKVNSKTAHNGRSIHRTLQNTSRKLEAAFGKKVCTVRFDQNS